MVFFFKCSKKGPVSQKGTWVSSETWCQAAGLILTLKSFHLTRDLTAGPLSSKTNIASGCFSIPSSHPAFSGLNFNLFVQPELGTIWDRATPSSANGIGKSHCPHCSYLQTEGKLFWEVLQHPKSCCKTLRFGTPLQQIPNRFPILCHNASPNQLAFHSQAE